MLYSQYYWHTGLSSMTHQLARQTQEFWDDVIQSQSVIAPLGKEFYATSQVLERLTRTFSKPHFNIPSVVVDGISVPIEEEIIDHKTFCHLIHFKKKFPKSCKDPKDPKVLVVSPLSGHYATLLRDTVKALLPYHDVYITDWQNARDIPLTKGSFVIDNFVDYLIDFLRQIGASVHVVAVCQPAVEVLMAASLMAEWKDPMAPANMILMGGPIDTRISPTIVNDFAQTYPLWWIEKNFITLVPSCYKGAHRLVYPGFIQLASFMMTNLDRHVKKQFDYYTALVQSDADFIKKHRDFYDEYFAVMDLTAEFFLETIDCVFQQHLLPKGQMTYHTKTPIRPAFIKNTGLMTVEGERDNISGLGQTKAAHDLCMNISDDHRCHYEQKDAGHYGIFSGHHWREEIMPRVAKFIRSHPRLG